MVRGAHTIKVGAELYPRMNIPFLQPQWPRGGFTFNGDSTRDPNNLGTPVWDSPLFCWVSEPSADSVMVYLTPSSSRVMPPYVQDDIKATKKLTLNLGLRYQFNDHTMEKHNAMANFDLATGALDIVKGRNDPLPAYFDSADIPVDRDAPRSLVPNQHLNFAPRVGVRL